MSKGSPGQGASSAPPKRRGRPNLPAGEGKRYALGLRTTKELRDLLQQAADSSGRSLAQEIEFRLERSFERERTLAELSPRAWVANGRHGMFKRSLVSPAMYLS